MTSMNRTLRSFLAATALLAIFAATPLFAHHKERDHCEERTGERCLGSEWCLSQPEGHHHTNRCYYWDETQDTPDAPDAPRPQKPPKPRRSPRKDVSKGDGKVQHRGRATRLATKFPAATETPRRVTCGTVSAVNKDASTITLTNADGKDVVVHISSFTRITVGSADVPPTSTTIDGIPAGSDAIIKAFNTDTQTLEASVVKIKTAL